MPIDIDSFESASEEHLGGGLSQPEQVLSFLASNADKAYRPVEIADATDIAENSINAVLTRLRNRELVRHRGNYWAITDDVDRLRSLTQYELATESLNELYGSEDPDEWVEHMPDEDQAAGDNS